MQNASGDPSSFSAVESMTVWKSMKILASSFWVSILFVCHRIHRKVLQSCTDQNGSPHFPCRVGHGISGDIRAVAWFTYTPAMSISLSSFGTLGCWSRQFMFDAWSLVWAAYVWLFVVHFCESLVNSCLPFCHFGHLKAAHALQLDVTLRHLCKAGKACSGQKPKHVKHLKQFQCIKYQHFCISFI